MDREFYFTLFVNKNFMEEREYVTKSSKNDVLLIELKLIPVLKRTFEIYNISGPNISYLF